MQPAPQIGATSRPASSNQPHRKRPDWVSLRLGLNSAPPIAPQASERADPNDAPSEPILNRRPALPWGFYRQETQQRSVLSFARTAPLRRAAPQRGAAQGPNAQSTSASGPTQFPPPWPTAPATWRREQTLFGAPGSAKRRSRNRRRRPTARNQPNAGWSRITDREEIGPRMASRGARVDVLVNFISISLDSFHPIHQKPALSARCFSRLAQFLIPSNKSIGALKKSWPLPPDSQRVVLD